MTTTEPTDFLANLPAPLSDEDLERRIAEHGRRAAAEAATELEREWRRMIPERFHWAHPKAPELEARVDETGVEQKKRVWPVFRDGSRPPCSVVLSRMAGHQGSIVFCGPSGSGKTSLAVAALHDRFRRPRPRSRPVVYIEARLLAIARMQHRGDGEPPIVLEAMRAGLLLLDDLGNERPIPTNAVPDVILHRYDANLPTWITTGLERADLDKLYGAGVVRRIYEDARVQRFERPKSEEKEGSS